MVLKCPAWGKISWREDLDMSLLNWSYLEELTESVDTMRARSRDPWFLTAIMISRTYIAGLAIAASMTERSPPITLGIPCKLFTPHVSVTFVRVFSCHLV